MKVLVTGAAGFIGSHLSETLLERGDLVIGLDNFSDYYSPERKRKNLEVAKKSKNFSFYSADVRNFSDVEKIFKKHLPNKVVHLASMAGVRYSVENPYIYEEVNVRGTLNMLELSKKYKVKKFVYSSSSSVYGNSLKTPFSETDLPMPISPYAASKLAGEAICQSYSHLYNLPCASLRFFTVYGPRGRPDMAPYKFVKLVSEGKPIDFYGDGSSRRDYTFVSDIVSGVVASLDVDFSYEVFNLGRSDTVDLKRFVSIVEKVVGKKVSINKMPMQPGDVPLTYANIQKASKILKYKPKVDIETGMRSFVEWYRKSA